MHRKSRDLERLALARELRRASSWAESLSPEDKQAAKLALDSLRSSLDIFVDAYRGAKARYTQEEQKRLSALIKECRASRAGPAELQRAIMEIGALTDWGNPRVAEALVALLKHPDVRVRVNVCQTLGRVGGRDAKRALLKALSDENTVVRRASLDALCTQTALALAERAQKLLPDDSPEVRRAGLEALFVQLVRVPPRLEEHKGGVRWPPELEVAEGKLNPEDTKNIAAFKVKGAALLSEHPGEYLAFHKGRFVDHGPGLSKLKERLAESYPGGRVMIVEPKGGEAGSGG